MHKFYAIILKASGPPLELNGSSLGTLWDSWGVLGGSLETLADLGGTLGGPLQNHPEGHVDFDSCSCSQKCSPRVTQKLALGALRASSGGPWELSGAPLRAPGRLLATLGGPLGGLGGLFGTFGVAYGGP